MITTKSTFFYGYTVEATSNTIRIDEGSGDVDIEIPTGKYALSDYVNIVSIAINNALDQDYAVTVDRATRLITISAPLNFEMKVDDIFPLNSGYPVMGFKNLVNLTGSNSYTSDSSSGQEYTPQFKLQMYVAFEDWNEYLDGVSKLSASGLEEVVSFGLQQFMECNIMYITDYPMKKDAPIEENLTGVADARAFLDYLITKGDIEFIPDRDDKNTFEKCRLESTKSSRKGLGYKLKEKRFNGIYETQTLKFRKV